jgi:hypothetical protein
MRVDLLRELSPEQLGGVRLRARNCAATKFFARALSVAVCLGAFPDLRAAVPWSEVERRVIEENRKLAARSQGHAGEYFVVCTIYYTPTESGFTAARGFDAMPVTKPGLNGRKYPRDFLRAVAKEGFGRIITTVNGKQYLRYNGHHSFAFASRPMAGVEVLLPRVSAAVRPRHPGLVRGNTVEILSPQLRAGFGNTRWKIVDTGEGLHHWQVDCYWGDDEPLGPGELMSRPRGASFEYAYAILRVLTNSTPASKNKRVTLRD